MDKMSESPQKFIALLTDFGARGMHYVAAMKAVILNINPSIKIIDISHEISPFSIIEASYLIKSVYIIHESGICLFEKVYSQNPVNKDLFSGYIKAMISFAREITNDKIMEVKMEKRNIYYEVKGDLLVTIVTSPKIPRKKLSFVFQCILTQFQERFREFLNHNILTREPFKSFSNDLDIL